MLELLLATNDIARETFAEAGDVLDLNLLDLIRHGPEHELAKTENTQLAMLVAGYAVWQCWRQHGLPMPLCCAGHSLGEYTGMCASGVLSFGDALRLVRQRGRLMAKHAPSDGCMLAVIGLDEQQVKHCCRQVGGDVFVANINSDSQIVLAGRKQAVTAAAQLCEEAGARKLVVLSVAVPAHSALLAAAAAEFSLELDKCSFGQAQFPVLHNIDAASHDSGELPKLLARHLYSPVRWGDTVTAMVDQGVKIVFELGPGKVLAALSRRPGLKTVAVDEQKQLEKALQLLQLQP